MSSISLPSVPKGLKDHTTSLLCEQRREAERALNVLAAMSGTEQLVGLVVGYLTSVRRFEHRTAEKENQALQEELDELRNQATVAAMALIASKLDGVTCDMMLDDLATASVRQMQLLDAPEKLDELYEARKRVSAELELHRSLASTMDPMDAFEDKLRIFSDFLLEVNRILGD